VSVTVSSVYVDKIKIICLEPNRLTVKLHPHL
jgi:hypothetical protein